MLSFNCYDNWCFHSLFLYPPRYIYISENKYLPPGACKRTSKAEAGVKIKGLMWTQRLVIIFILFLNNDITFVAHVLYMLHFGRMIGITGLTST